MGKSLFFSAPDIITYKIRTVLFNPYFEVKVKSVKPLAKLGMALRTFDSNATAKQILSNPAATSAA